MLKRTFIFIIVLCSLNSCHTKQVTSAEKSAKVKARIERKQKAEREKKRKKAMEEHYEKQAESTKKMMQNNAAASEQWRKNSYPGKPFFKRIGDFFKELKPEPRPKDGIYTKKQRKDRKPSFLKRIFKKKKKK